MKKIGIICFVFLFCSCGSGRNDFSGEILRQGEDLPVNFHPPEGFAFEENSCKSPLIDPRDGTQIMMIRSTGSMGEYDPPEGKYGLKRNELLRINCQTGEVYGVVRR